MSKSALAIIAIAAGMAVATPAMAISSPAPAKAGQFVDGNNAAAAEFQLAKHVRKHRRGGVRLYLNFGNGYRYRSPRCYHGVRYGKYHPCRKHYKRRHLRNYDYYYPNYYHGNRHYGPDFGFSIRF